MGYVYKITNDVNAKVYVGKTCHSLEKRFSEHIGDLEKRRNENRPLYRAMRKYGIEHFSVCMVEECDDTELSVREQYWIKRLHTYETGYNATAGGDGKIQFDHDAILNELIINPYPIEVANKFGCCVDIVRDIAKTHGINICHNQEFLRQSSPSKEIIGFGTNGIVRFDSASQAAEWVYSSGRAKTLNSGVRSHIADCANGKRTSAYGYKWKYSDFSTAA